MKMKVMHSFSVMTHFSSVHTYVAADKYPRYVMTHDVGEVILSILASDVKVMHLRNSITLSYGSIMP
jgi:hypothetical protein